MKALALLHVSLTVGNLARASAFLVDALGFTGPVQAEADPALATLLGARRLSTMTLHRGGQSLELAAFDAPGQPYPPGSRSNDIWFQHCALVTDDIAQAYARLSPHPHAAISRSGPETLPGGIVAFKFRDAEGHPFELIQFPQPDPATAGGIDHSAISVADAGRSIAFYAETLGLTVASRQVNTGPAQDAMDGLDGTVVDVVGLAPAQAAPHLELLAYRSPPGRSGKPLQPADVAASRLVFQVDSLAGYDAVNLADGRQAALIHDPDGHALLLLA